MPNPVTSNARITEDGVRAALKRVVDPAPLDPRLYDTFVSAILTHAIHLKGTPRFKSPIDESIERIVRALPLLTVIFASYIAIKFCMNIPFAHQYFPYNTGALAI